jgi:DNA-binding LacI/PurR family transcriptional regulator
MTSDRAFNLQRRERLLAELRRRGAVRVHDLAVLLEVSDVTVRRDIIALAAQQLLTRVHGGAMLPAPATPTAAKPRRARTPATRITLGMVVPSLDFYWPSVIDGARAAAAALGADIQLRGSSYDTAEDRRQITRLIDTGAVHGLLLAPDLTGAGAAELVEWIGDRPVPSVRVERLPPTWGPAARPLEWVRTDHGLGIELAARHLWQLGHHRIGLVLSTKSPTSEHLARGWATACAGLGLPDDMVIRASVRLDEPGHRQAIGDILRRCDRSRVTALIVHSDPDAMAVAQLCAEQGRRIPDDLALVSYDDEVAHLSEPALTAVRPAKRHVGRVAVELAVSRLLEGDRRPSQRVLVCPELVIRASSVPRPDR